jgi:hypothetical protein
MSNAVLPPAPYQSPITDKQGMLTAPWTNWIRQLFIQTGGASSTSLASLITTVSNLNSTVSTLETNTGTLESEVNGLSQGRVI